jgi:hypothetical protein
MPQAAPAAPLPPLYSATYARPPGTGPINPWAIVALVLALSCYLGVLAVPLAVYSLRQIQQDGGRGQGLAVTALVLGSLTTVGLLVSLVT